VEGGEISACFTTSATVSLVIFRSLQYLELSQSMSSFAPLLELHAMQQRAMFSLEIIFASLTMCSHEALDFLVPQLPNLTPQ
jgi:hypothetical protein